MKPKGFDLIESDVGEDTVHYLKRKRIDENAISIFAQVYFCSCLCLKSVMDEF